MWPSGAAGWSVQQNQAMTATNRSAGGYDGFPIADDGKHKSLLVTPVTENLFFRLMHP
jgi:hypothetical protein